MFNVVVVCLVNDDLLYGFEWVEVKFLWYQVKLVFGIDDVFFQIVVKDIDLIRGFVYQ